MTHLEIQYNLWLVALSFVIAVISSFSALNLAGKISNSTGKTKILWLLSGSCVMGCGVWSMHFIGMLATHIAIPVYYDPTMTALSAIASVIASLIAFLVTSDQQPSKWRIGLGGMVMGSGIVIMHYSGMAAIQSAATLSHDPLLLAVSILIAMLTSYSALYLFRRFRNKPQYHLWKLFCSVLMGLAIGGMHYTGMAASSFHLHGDIHVESHLNEYNFSLIASVSIVTFLILFISLIAVFFDHHILERMAFYDYLTDLPNRYGLVQYFDLQFNLTESGAILFIDIDRFKTINDTLGHDVGDMLIQQIAKRLRNCIGEKDKVFRLGGDEFLIASPDGDEKTAVLLADRILHEIKKPCYIEDHELYVTASIGISLAPIHGFDRSSLMKWQIQPCTMRKMKGKIKLLSLMKRWDLNKSVA
ncbi:MHYT domain-containing protein [Caldalkalibacillus mannanilyticus]|uniref:MHYT domain-containing protein n=1 Tax=Caldalkalibacillus mannanilyticus TaxID=1418 RepID=UPI000AAF2F4C|nr:MHYT domain-containing protein [Caldalkalibacillus mannanilyticus]